MTDNRITQQSVLVTADQSVPARVSQQAIQVVSDVSAFARITQQAISTVGRQKPPARISQQAMMTVAKIKPPRSGDAKAQIITTAKSSPLPVAGDDYFEKVQLLLRSDRGLVDCSKFHRQVSGDRRIGPFVQPLNAKFDTCFRQPAPGNNSDWSRGCALAPGPQWNLKAGRFTIEGWFRTEGSMSGGAGMVGVHDWGTGATSSWGIILGGLRNPGFWFWDENNVKYEIGSTAFTVAFNTWFHICVDRDDDGVIRLYLDGVMIGSLVFTGKIKDMPTTPIYVGGAGISDSYRFKGAFDDIRITKGIARYASNTGFSVPTQHYSFRSFTDPRPDKDPYWSEVVLLFDPLTAGMVDESPRAAPLTRTGGGAVPRTSQGMFWGVPNTNKLYDLGTMVTVEDVDSQNDLGEGGLPFTIEMAMNYYATQGATSQQQYKWVGVMTQWASAGNYTLLRYNGATYSAMSLENGPHGYQETDWNVWTYDERKTLRYYYNGTLRGIAYNVDFPSAPNTILQLGGTGGGPRLSDVRVTKGVARWTDDFCIPGYDTTTKPFKFGDTYVPPDPAEPPTFPYLMETYENRAMGIPTVAQWVNLSGGIPGRTTEHEQRAGRAGAPDDYFVFHLQSTTRLYTGQSMLIPAAFFDELSGVEVKATLSMAYGINIPATTNLQGQGTYGLRALDANGVVIAALFDANQTGQAWNDKSLEMMLPPNTRSVQMVFISYNPDTFPSTFFHGFKVVLDAVEDIYHLPNPSFPMVPAEWTVNEGTATYTIGIDFGMTGLTTTGIQSELQYGADLPDALDTDIDAGRVAFNLFWFVFAHSGDVNDAGRIWFEFTDDAGTLVGVRQFERPDFAPAPLGGKGVSMSRPIPAGARKVRYGFRGQLSINESGVPSFYPLMFGSYCSKPAVMPANDPVPVPGPDDDPYWKHVNLLLSSRNGAVENLADVPTKTFTTTGTVQHATAPSKFGDAHVIEINPTGASRATDYLTVVPYPNALNTCFTFEGWFRVDLASPRANMGISNQMGAWHGLSNGSGHHAAVNLVANGNVPYDEWFHHALVRLPSGETMMFVNGKKQDVVLPEYLTQWAATYELFRNGTSGSYNSWVGQADEIRITDGVARYTEDFIPQSDRYPTTDGFLYDVDRLDALFLGGGGSGSNSASNTFANFPVGPASANRRILVAAIRPTSQATNVDPTSVTVGGIAATKLHSTIHNYDATWGFNITWWVAEVPTGTTASVVIVWPAAGYRAGFMAWALKEDFDLHDTGDGSPQNGSTPSDLQINTATGGLLLAVGLSGGGGIAGNQMNAAWDYIRSNANNREIAAQRDKWTGIAGSGYWHVENDGNANHNLISAVSLRPKSWVPDGVNFWGIRVKADEDKQALSFAEIEFYEDWGRPEIARNGTPYATQSYYSTPPSNALDGNAGSVWGTEDATADQIWWVELPDPVNVNIVSLRPRGSYYPSQRPDNFDVVYSIDGSTWQIAWSIRDYGDNWAGPQGSTALEDIFVRPGFDPATTQDISVQRFWGLQFEKTGSNAYAFSELEMHATAGGPNILTGGTPGSTGYWGSLYPSLALDGDVNTTFGTSDNAYGQKWWYDFGEGNEVIVNEVLMRARTSGIAGEVNQTPLRFWVIASQDGVNWRKMWLVDETTPWTSSEVRVFTSPVEFT